MVRRFPAVDIPVCIAAAVVFRAVAHSIEQNLEAVIGHHLREIRSMRAELAEQRSTVEINSLANDRNSQAWKFGLFSRDRGLEALGVLRSGQSEGVQLMGRPQMRRELLDKLGRRINPVETLEVGRKLY